MFPVYCIECRKHIPKAESNFTKGYCEACMVKRNPPPQVVQSQPPPQAATPAVHPSKPAPNVWKWVALSLIGICLFPFFLGIAGVMASPSNRDDARISAEVTQARVVEGSSPGYQEGYWVVIDWENTGNTPICEATCNIEVRDSNDRLVELEFGHKIFTSKEWPSDISHSESATADERSGGFWLGRKIDLERYAPPFKAVATIASVRGR